MTPIQSSEKKVLAEPSVSGTNILYSLQELVCRIQSQLSRLSQETQSRSQSMKKEFRIETDKAANLTKEVGNAAPWISGIALLSCGVSSVASRCFGENLVKPFETALGKLPKFVESLGQLKTSPQNAEIGRLNSVTQLRQTEISNETQKSGEARDLQSQLDSILANIRELFKKASS